jgi:transposase InsO family protein
MRGVTFDFSRPGKPTDNAFIESLNGKFRAECKPVCGRQWESVGAAYGNPMRESLLRPSNASY